METSCSATFGSVNFGRCCLSTSEYRCEADVTENHVNRQGKSFNCKLCFLWWHVSGRTENDRKKNQLASGRRWSLLGQVIKYTIVKTQNYDDIVNCASVTNCIVNNFQCLVRDRPGNCHVVETRSRQITTKHEKNSGYLIPYCWFYCLQQTFISTQGYKKIWSPWENANNSEKTEQWQNSVRKCEQNYPERASFTFWAVKTLRKWYSSRVGENMSELFCCLWKKSSHMKMWSFQGRNIDTACKITAENRLCFAYIHKKHGFRSCPRLRKCSKDGCTSSHETLLHRVDGVLPSKPRNTQHTGKKNKPKFIQFKTRTTWIRQVFLSAPVLRVFCRPL